MPIRRGDSQQRVIELLEKLVLLQLHALGTPQDKAARLLGKQKAWVNAALKGLPKARKEK
jgi:hypothetical protein